MADDFLGEMFLRIALNARERPCRQPGIRDSAIYVRNIGRHKTKGHPLLERMPTSPQQVKTNYITMTSDARLKHADSRVNTL